MMSLFTNNSIKVWWNGAFIFADLVFTKNTFQKFQFSQVDFHLNFIEVLAKAMWLTAKVCGSFLFWSKLPFFIKDFVVCPTFTMSEVDINMKKSLVELHTQSSRSTRRAWGLVASQSWTVFIDSNLQFTSFRCNVNISPNFDN